MFSRLRSNSQPIKPDGKVVYQGFLEKRGRLNTAFKKRWCVLKEDGKLYYYTPSDKESPQDSIILENVVVRMAYSEAFAFEIVTKDRVYHFLAPSLEERTAWLKALSAKTSLDSENSLIEKAEEMISRATYLKCKSDEEREAEQALSPRSSYISSTTSIIDSGSPPTSTSATSHTHLPPSHLRSFTSASHLLSSSSSASLSASLSRSHSSPVLASLDPLPSAGSSEYLPDLLYPPPSPQLQHIQQHPQHMQHVYSSTPPLHSSLSTSHTTYHPQHAQQQHDLKEDQKEKKKETKSKTKSFLNLGYNSSQRISRRRKGDI